MQHRLLIMQLVEHTASVSKITEPKDYLTTFCRQSLVSSHAFSLLLEAAAFYVGDAPLQASPMFLPVTVPILVRPAPQPRMLDPG